MDAPADDATVGAEIAGHIREMGRLLTNLDALRPQGLREEMERLWGAVNALAKAWDEAQ